MTWQAIVILWLLGFLFSGLEAAVLAVNPVRLRHHFDRGARGAKVLNKVMHRPELTLISVSILGNFCAISALVMLTMEFVNLWGTAGFVAVAVLAVPAYVIGLELLPKSLFRRFPYRLLKPWAGTLLVIQLILWPVTALGSLLTRIFAGKSQKERGHTTQARERFKHITSETEKQGVLNLDERNLIHGVVDFRSKRVSEIMVPMEKALTVTQSTDCQEALELSQKTDIDRLPVLDDDGYVIGLVSTFDILYAKPRPQKVASFLRRIVRVEASAPVHEVIRKLRAARLKLASVIDENGKPLGIITIDDAINPLVRNVLPKE